MPLFSQFNGCCSVHAVFQMQQLFIKMMQRRTFTLLVAFKTMMLNSILLRLVQRSALAAPVGECPGYANGTNCIEPVSILNNHAFQTAARGSNSRTFKGYLRNYLQYPFNGFCCKLLADSHSLVLPFFVSESVSFQSSRSCSKAAISTMNRSPPSSLARNNAILLTRSMCCQS
jgi:hypothetical protein